LRAPIIVASLAVFSISSHEIPRSPFPPFYEAAKYLKDHKNVNTNAFLPGDFNQFLSAWPVQPGFTSSTAWVATAVKDGNKPDVILLFPFVNPAYEISKENKTVSGKMIKIRNLGNGLGLIDLRKDTNSKLKVLSQIDYGGSELWFALLGLRISHKQQNDFEVSEWLEHICKYSETPISLGTLFGDFSRPQITINEFLIESRLPICSNPTIFRNVS